MSDGAPAAGWAIALAALVAVVGMPHGGLDHLFGRAVFRPAAGRWWRPAFATAYLGVAAVVVAGWVVAPAATVVLFFLISAYHFGDADGAVGPGAVVEGGLVVWVPLLARPAEVADILGWVIPAADVTAVRSAVEAARPLVWAAGGAVAVRVLLRAAGGDWLTAARLTAFAGVLAAVPVLVGFGLYFCGWHSLRELAALARRADPARPWRGLRGVVRLAAPRAGLAVAVTGVAAWWFAAGRDVTPVVVQAVFVGLSAVAVPHILLHAAAEQRRADPFVPGAGVWPTRGTT